MATSTEKETKSKVFDPAPGDCRAGRLRNLASDCTSSGSEAKERKRLGIPPVRKFATKIELGWQMIERVRGAVLPLEIVCCDTIFGRSYWLRRKMSGAGLLYCADFPVDTKVYLEKPVMGLPPIN